MTERITIAGEIYSPNLGDGLIYDTLVFLFQKVSPRLKVVSLDISGRTGYQEARNRSLQLTLSTLGRRYGGGVYNFLNAFRIWFTYQMRWKKVWCARLQMTDQLVIGGGQLIMDNHLDFPLKLYLLVNLAQQFQIPYHLVAVGVGDKWSRLGLRWMQAVVKGAKTITVRDEASLWRMKHLFERVDTDLGSDPALWSADLYGRDKTKEPAKIGINLINLLDFNKKRISQRQISPQEWETSWKNLVLALSRSELAVELFTNGNQLDEEWANRVWRAVLSQASHVTKAPCPQFPRDLAQQIQNYRLIIATRLHTNILAACYNIPVVALAWDNKVDQFFRSMQRTEWVFPPTILFTEALVREIFQMNGVWDEDILTERKQSILAKIQMLLPSEME